MHEISLYRKYNRCRDGPLTVGDTAPNVELHRIDGTRIDLHDLVCGARKLVVFAGSYS